MSRTEHSSTSSSGDSPDNETYYQVLGVPRDATEEDIRNAYKRLARRFHPDKHTSSDELRETANAHFTLLSRAHEVLTDPLKRVIYDELGEEGLSSGFELSFPTKDPQQLRREYELHRKQREREQEEAELNISGAVVTAISAVELINPYPGVPRRAEIQSLAVQQGFETSVSQKDTVYVGAFLGTGNGRGDGHLKLRWKRFLAADRWMQVSGNLAGLHSLLSATMWQKADEYQVYRLGVELQNWRAGIIMAQRMQLWEKVNGEILLRVGAKEAAVMELSGHTGDDDRIEWKTELEASMDGLSVGASAGYTDDTDRTCIVSSHLGSNALELELGVSRPLSERVTVGASTSIRPGRLGWKLSFQRGPHQFLFPISLLESFSLAPALLAAAIPFVADWALYKWYFAPKAEQEKQEERERAREESAEFVRVSREKSLREVQLLRENAQRKLQAEKRKGGLVVNKALFGAVSESGTPIHQGDQEGVVDVTLSVQHLVEDSKLVLSEMSKHRLAGFYDPIPGEEKYLYVQYTFRGRLHAVRVHNNERLVAPARNQVVDV